MVLYYIIIRQQSAIQFGMEEKTLAMASEVGG